MKPDQTVLRNILIMVHIFCNICFQSISADEKADDICLGGWKMVRTKTKSICSNGDGSCLNHTAKCIRRFAGIYAYCRYFIDRKW